MGVADNLEELARDFTIEQFDDMISSQPETNKCNFLRSPTIRNAR
jgi:hypothetical protein